MCVRTPATNMTCSANVTNNEKIYLFTSKQIHFK